MPHISLSPDPYPAGIGEIADACSLETQLRAGAQSFEDHYLTCGHCAAAVEKAERYVRAMIAAERMPCGGGSAIN